MSNERIRQALKHLPFATVPWNQPIAKLTQPGEVEFRDVDHCITSKDGFTFVTSDFMKPTAEGRQAPTKNHTTKRRQASQSYLQKQ